MSESSAALAARVEDVLAGKAVRVIDRHDQVTVEVDSAEALEVMRTLRDHESLEFRELIDLCGVDYSGYGKADWKTSEVATGSGFSRGVERGEYREASWAGSRFAVAYQLLSISHNRRLRVRVPASGEPPVVDSVVDIWPCANWFEREAFDLFGILFSGHPDLRRILTDYGFVGHPFRKDFPLIGHVEVRYDASKGRVVYEPVSIEPRTLVPRVIRHDNRYAEHRAPAAAAEAGEEAGDA